MKMVWKIPVDEKTGLVAVDRRTMTFMAVDDFIASMRTQSTPKIHGITNHGSHIQVEIEITGAGVGIPASDISISTCDCDCWDGKMPS